jgi:hypothetical protein
MSLVRGNEARDSSRGFVACILAITNIYSDSPGQDGTMMRSSLVRSPAFCILLLPVVVSGQAVGGRVTERSSGVVVSRVAVVAFDTGEKVRAATLTDSLGIYGLTLAREGTYRLSFQRQGLVTQDTRVTLLTGAHLTLDMIMSMGAVDLAPVTVEAERVVNPPPGNPHKYDDFLRRRALGLGHYLTRADIESRPNTETRYLFQNIPGIKLRIDGVRWYLQSQRCAGRTIPGLDAGALVGGGAGADTSSKAPKIFVDGLPAYGMDILREIPPSEIEAIEVYQGASQIPAASKGNSCFAIFVWLR